MTGVGLTVSATVSLRPIHDRRSSGLVFSVSPELVLRSESGGVERSFALENSNVNCNIQND